MIAVPIYEPTPADIARECAVIRAAWTPDEERRRRAGGNGRVAWNVPGSDRGHEIVDRETLHGFAGQQ